MELSIRPWTQADADPLNAAVAESREHLRPWMAWASLAPMTPAARRAWIADGERAARAGESENMGIFCGERIAGGCGLHHRIGPGGLEIGYWVHPAFLRRGVATWAVRELCAVAFARPSVTRLEIHHDPANVASGGVAAAAGFRDAGLVGGGAEDRAATRIWRLERDGWDPGSGVRSEP